MSFSEKMTQMYSRIPERRCEKVLKAKSLLLLGPRQVGKSTLIRSLKPDVTINLARQSEYLDHLKDPSLLERITQVLPKRSMIFINEV